MKTFRLPINLLVLMIIAMLSFTNWSNRDRNWLSKKGSNYVLYYTIKDKKNIKAYSHNMENGVQDVIRFFNKPYNKKFDVFVHPNRHSLDSTWQKDWSMPDFKSECWMVASGVAAKLDIISPKAWTQEACEHDYLDKNKTQKLITHELVHVFHGQHNVSPDFSNVEGIDWFVEGLATHGSGQCDSARIAEVMKDLAENKIPSRLDDFWKGKLRYGLSGSVVMFLDKKYGRKKLVELLPFNKKQDILNSLEIAEDALLVEWKDYMIKNYSTKTK